LSKVISSNKEKVNFFGTSELSAYKKMCEAVRNAWEAEKNSDYNTKMNFYQNAKKLIHDAIDFDNNFAEAYYFLASYYLQESIICCLMGEDTDADRKALDARTMIYKAVSLKSSIRDLPLTATVFNMIEDGGAKCDFFRKIVKESEDRKKLKEMRLNDFQAYIEDGRAPKILVSTLDNLIKPKLYSKDKVTNIGISLYYFTFLNLQSIKSKLFSSLQTIEGQIELFNDFRLLLGYNTKIDYFSNSNKLPKYHIGLNIGSVAARYTIPDVKGTIIQKWSFDFITKQPGSMDNNISLIWSFGTGQIQLPDFTTDKINEKNLWTIKTAFDFKLSGFIWMKIEGIWTPDSEQFNQVCMGIGTRF
jgi:hypothetical protein